MDDAARDSLEETERPWGAWRLVRRVVVVLIGVPITLLGIALLVAPGPGTPLVIAGLAILATEFAWAQRHVDRLRALARRALRRESAPRDT